jgi:PAS domain S-box-containing protein
MPIGSLLVFIVIDQSIRRNKNERDLRLSQERLMGISESIPDLLIILDEDGKYLEIFGTDQSLLVAPKEELIGKSLKDVLPAEKADFFLIWIKSVIDENATKETEYTLDTLAGLKYSEARASAMKATFHDKRAVAIMTRDITKYKIPSSVIPA